jgi:transposase
MVKGLQGIAESATMLNLSHGIRIFLCREPTDMRLGYEGLRTRALYHLKFDPLSGNLFVFFNKSINRCKILFYDKGGLCLFCKRLEMGTFAIPSVAQLDGRIEIDRVELLMFLDGVIAQTITRKKRFIANKNREVALH